MINLHDIEIGVPGPILPPISSVIKNSQKLEDIGYDGMWFVDHFMGFVPESIWTPDITPLAKIHPNPHIFLETYSTMTVASLNTKRINIGSSVTDSVRRHPALIAQTFLTLDHISNGRIILGIGSGEIENTQPYGIDYSERTSRLRECLEIIRLLWTSNSKVDFDGQFWKFRDAIIALEPSTKSKYPPIWVAAHGPKTFKIAAEFGDGWLPISLSTEEYRESLAIILKYRRKLDKSDDEFKPSLWSWLIADDNHEECHRIMNSVLGRFYALMMPSARWKSLGFKHPLGNYNLFTDFVPTRWTRQAILSAINSVPFEVTHEFYIHGTLEDIIKRVSEYGRAGLEHIILGNMTGTFAPEKSKESYRIIQNMLEYIKSS